MRYNPDKKENNMKKIVSVIICCAMLLSLAACGSSKSNEKTLDMSSFTSKVMSTVKYDDELIALSEKVVDKYYDLSFDGLEEYTIYVSGSAATTNELAVFKCSGSSAIEAAKTSVEKRLSEQNELYASYLPAEVYRLENALVKTNGNYLLLSVSDDNETVEKLFDEALK